MAASDPASSSASHHFVGVEVVLFTLDERVLRVALVLGELPSGAVSVGKELDAAARRVLRDDLGLDAPVRQFHAFSRSVDDPDQRAISIAYTALLPITALRPLVSERLSLIELRDGVLRNDNGSVVALPEGQAEVVAFALADLRLHLATTSWSYGLLPEEFTLRALQHAHEAISGRSFNRVAFRKRMLDSRKLVATGRRESDQRFRPAELYRLAEEHARDR